MTPTGGAHQPDATSADRIARALLRIEQSRTALRETLIPTRSSAHAGGSTPQRWLALLRHWLGSTPLAPLAKPAWAAARGWWRRQPWHTAVEAVGHIVSREFIPLVRRHPVAAVGTAAAAGAVLFAARRCHNRRGLRTGRRSTGATLPWLWRQLSQPSVQMALATALAAWGSHQAAAGAAPASHDTASAPGQASGQGR